MVRSWTVVVALVSCSRPHPNRSPTAPPAPAVSNILRADYIGSAACADCHADLYKAWAASPMRNMTRDAETASIRAPFEGASLRVGPDTCTMETVAGARIMRVESPSGQHQFKVTKIVGGRYREDFVGVEQGGGDGLEHVLPGTFVFSTRSWRYKGYSVMVRERPRMSWQGQWSQECIGCHNTLPAVAMLYDELYGSGLPPYQGKLADRVLPAQRKWRARIDNPVGLARAIDDEIRFLGGTATGSDEPHTVLPIAATTMEQRLDGNHLVELGIGCEACHNGARVHVSEPAAVPTFELKSTVMTAVPPRGETGTRAQWINHTCAKCHTVLFTHYPWTWEGGKRQSATPGGSSISSGEGRDFQLGACASKLACTTRHDPHVADDPAKLRDMATPHGNHLCTTCHAAYANDDALARHSHHQVGAPGSGCIACHMAKKNMGLDYVLNRYHRIGSPTDPSRVERDRPLECALCHADKSVGTLITAMETWWGKRYDRGALAKLYGNDLAVNAMRATLALGKPHEQAVAIATFGELRDKGAIAALVPMLRHDYPLLRFFAQRALQRITGDAVAIDLNGAAADVGRAADAWFAAHH